MKNKIVVGLIFVFAVALNATAQIENEIKNYVDSTEIMINNGRKLLVKSIQNGDLQKAQEVFHYLMMKAEEKNCSPFNYREQLLINAAFKDVTAVLKLVESYTDDKVYFCYRNMEPIEDALYAELKKNKPTPENSVTSIPLHADDLDILSLMSHILQNGTNNDKYSLLIKKFKKKYPHSRYSKFVEEYLPKPEPKSSISYSLGPKYNFLTGNFAKYFHNPLGVGFSMDFCLNKVYVSLYMDGAPMKLLQPITLSNKNHDAHDFVAGDVFSRMDIGFKTGYYLVRNSKIHVAPYATLLSGGFMDSNLYKSENRADDEFTIYDSFTPGLGVNFEYKLGGYNSKSTQPYMYGFESRGYFSLKIDAGFVTIPTFRYLPAKGDMGYITLGLVWGIGEF